MKVLKFGGTSVANNISINKVIEIVSKQSDKSVVVVSALGGVTDLLDLIMNKALKNDKSFSLELDIIKKRHIELIKKSIKIVNQSKTISFLKNELITKVLSNKLFVGIGLISYSLYLFHYPIFAFVRSLRLATGVIEFSIVATIIFIVSTISYYVIEKPFRNPKIISNSFFLHIF